MKLSLHLAWRFLRDGRAQSLLILAGVAIGVAAFVFVASIISSLQRDLIARTLGAQAQVTVTPREASSRALLEAEGALVARRVEPPVPRRRSFDGWPRYARALERTPGVSAVCPRVSGPALAGRGASEEAVVVVGADPARLRRIIDLAPRLVGGRYAAGGDRALVGDGLAEALGLRVGAPFRVSTDRGAVTLRVVGIFDTGAAALDDAWVVTSLRTAQTITGRAGDVTELDARVEDLYAAESIARNFAARTGLEATSWMQRSRDLLIALRAQDQSSYMIQLFVMLAVAMGIASVLVVSVVQRRGQIGILRAIGTSRRTVLAVFLWQGVILGAVGAVLGIALGVAFAIGLGQVTPFPIEPEPSGLAIAASVSLATGLVAALLPARRAATMDPAAAIRGDA